MEVKIGVQSVPREIVVETETSAEEVERLLAAALAEGEHAVFALSVAKGGRILVPADKIAYVEFGPNGARRVGFGNLALCPGLHAGSGYARVCPRVYSCRVGPDEGFGSAPGIVENN